MLRCTQLFLARDARRYKKDVAFGAASGRPPPRAPRRVVCQSTQRRPIVCGGSSLSLSSAGATDEPAGRASIRASSSGLDACTRASSLCAHRPGTLTDGAAAGSDVWRPLSGYIWADANGLLVRYSSLSASAQRRRDGNPSSALTLSTGLLARTCGNALTPRACRACVRTCVRACVRARPDATGDTVPTCRVRHSVGRDDDDCGSCTGGYGCTQRVHNGAGTKCVLLLAHDSPPIRGRVSRSTSMRARYVRLTNARRADKVTRCCLEVAQCVRMPAVYGLEARGLVQRGKRVVYVVLRWGSNPDL